MNSSPNLSEKSSNINIKVNPSHYLRLQKINRMFLVDSDNLSFLLQNWETNGLSFRGILTVPRPVSMAVHIAQLLCSFIERALTFLVILAKPDISDKKLSHRLRDLYSNIPNTVTFEYDSKITRQIEIMPILKATHLNSRPSTEDYLDLHSVNLRYETAAEYKIKIIRSEVSDIRNRLEYLIMNLIINYQNFLGEKGKAEYAKIEDRGHYVSTSFEIITKNFLVDIAKSESFTIKSEEF